MNERSSLFHRKLPLSVDVADAIENLVARDGEGLPLALTVEQISVELVRISTIDDDNDPVILPASAQEAVYDKFANHLMTSSIFKAGYKTYEERSRNQVVPVTAFFFKAIYTDEARECLDTMTDFDIKKSLPARPSQLTDENGNPLDIDEDEDANARSGRTAGIAVFPMDYRVSGHAPKLVGVWLRRGVNVVMGMTEAMTNRLEHAASNSPRLNRLKESQKTANRDMVAALPKPRA